jgi:hypothetical protein
MVLIAGVWRTVVPDVAAIGAVASSLTKIALELSVSPVDKLNVGVT